MSNIAIYIRVSTFEQVKEGYSIAAQKERLTAFCKAQGWKNYKFYIDEGVSAKDTNREKLKELLNDMEKDKVSTILVYRLDRFTRSVMDLHKMLERMEKHNCVFKSATEPYDTSTAMGRMFITIVAALAQWEAENLSERVQMALEEKVSKGQRVGNIPYGFDLNEEEKLVANDRAEIVLDMIDKSLSGWSLNRIADFLTKTNNDKSIWKATTVIRILTNPALYGATRWNDKIYENTHEGIISKEKFDKLQQVLKDRSLHRLRSVKSTYLFQGVLVCPNCNKFMSVNRYVRNRSDGSTYQNAIYRCQPCEKQGFRKSYGEQRFIDALYEYMKEIQIRPESIPKPEIDIHEQQLADIERKREKYQRAWASDLMTDDEFKKLMDETKEIYESLKAKTANKIKQVDPEQIKGIVFTFNENFQKLTQDEKREFVARFIRQIEFKVIQQPPLRKDKSKRGKPKIVINNIVFM